jgi:hypothetical protein
MLLAVAARSINTAGCTLVPDGRRTEDLPHSNTVGGFAYAKAPTVITQYASHYIHQVMFIAL